MGGAFGCRPFFKEGRPSFLKKRSKKLLSIGSVALMVKSFLVLFFKKELLPYFL
jgi:hypothetical protein